jgi:hypothetical protein
VRIIEPCNIDEAITVANLHDVGLLAPPHLINKRPNINAQYALPNKLFVYASAGLALGLTEWQYSVHQILRTTSAVEWINDDNPRTAAQGIQQLLDNPQKVADMKRESWRWAQKYTPDKERDKLVDIYRQVLHLSD